ncbi:hypothetical protein K8R42_03225 [bacterium]|nr:hypothetical protein [bacterium]
MSWEKIKFKLDLGKLFKNHKIYFLGAAVFLFSMTVLIVNTEHINNLNYENTSKKYIQLLDDYIENDINKLRQDAQEMSKMEDVRQYIKENNTIKLAEILNHEKQVRELNMMLATNKDGVAIYRGLLQLHRGDYIFQNNDWGHELAKGNRVNAVVKGPNIPLFLTSAEPIMENGKVMGSISASTRLDDEYAINIKENFFANGTEVLFYSNEAGLIATSSDLQDQETKKNEIRLLLNNYFNTTNNNLPDKGLPAFANIDGKKYYISMLVFPGIESSPGSAFLLIPHKCDFFIILFSLIFGLAFVATVTIHTNRKNKIWATKKKVNKKYYLIITIAALIIFVVSYTIINNACHKKFTRIKMPPYTIYNSILKVEPQFATLDSNFQTIISVVIEPGGEDINAISASINYDPEIVEIVDIIKDNSICRTDMFIEKTIIQEEGILTVSCVLPNYKLNIRKGLVAKLVVKPIQEGSFMLSFDASSQVLANDGLGTDVLRAAIGGFYQVEDYLSSQTGINKKLIFSHTHPNSNRWYSEKNISFSVLNHQNNTYLYLFDQDPQAIPNFGDEVSSEDYLNFKATGDGVYYLHIRPIENDQLGPISHFKIMIDSTPPNFIEKSASQTTINANDIVRLFFAAQDSASGIQSYYIKIENDLFLPVASPIYIPFMNSGTHTITIRAFDNANNYTDEIIQINVEDQSWIKKLFGNIRFEIFKE